MDMSGDRNHSHDGHMYSFVCYDIATGFVGAYPSHTKTTVEVYRNLQHFGGPQIPVGPLGQQGQNVIKYVFSDGAGELKAACRLMQIPHDCAESGEPQNRAVAERQIQEVSQGTAINLVQSGVPHAFWPEAMQHFVVANNIRVDKRGDSPWNRRHAAEFEGQQIPFGARIRFIPLKTSPHYKEKQKFAENAIEGVFLGWKMNIGEKWSKLYVVAPFEDFEPYSLLRGDMTGQVHVIPQEVSRVWPASHGTPWEFPLKERYDRANGTLGGKADALIKKELSEFGWSPKATGTIVDQPQPFDPLELAKHRINVETSEAGTLADGVALQHSNDTREDPHAPPVEASTQHLEDGCLRVRSLIWHLIYYLMHPADLHTLALALPQ